MPRESIRQRSIYVYTPSGCVPFTIIPATPVIEYPFGLPLLAIFMVIAYGLIKRRTGNPESI